MKKSTAHKKIFRWKRFLFLCGMMAIPVFFGICYDLFIKLQTVSFMFRDQTGKTFGFYYISWAFEQLADVDSDVFAALKYFFYIFLIFNFVCMPLQVVMSYFFHKKVPATGFFRVVFYLPTLLSPVITSTVFGVFMDNIYGLVPKFLSQLGVQISSAQGLLYSPDTAFPSLIFYEIWISLGVSTLIYTAAINKVPAEVFEAARIDGANNAQELFRIVFPMISGILSVGFLSNTIAGFNIYSEILLLTDPAQSKLYTVAYLITERAKSRQYFASAGIGFVFTIFAIPVIGGLRKLFDKILPDVSY